jgi:hypothetical protein
MFRHSFSMPDLPDSRTSQHEVNQDSVHTMANTERAQDDDFSESNYYAKIPIGEPHVPETGSITRTECVQPRSFPLILCLSPARLTKRLKRCLVQSLYSANLSRQWHGLLQCVMHHYCVT